MNPDQRSDDQPIRSGELPIPAEPPANPSDLPSDEEFEETSFSKWILPISLFLATIFTTLWAGAYQVYNGPIHGPVNFLLEQPMMLWQGIPFAVTLLVVEGEFALQMEDRRDTYRVGESCNLAAHVIHAERAGAETQSTDGLESARYHPRQNTERLCALACYRLRKTSRGCGADNADGGGVSAVVSGAARNVRKCALKTYTPYFLHFRLTLFTDTD